MKLLIEILIIMGLLMSISPVFFNANQYIKLIVSKIKKLLRHDRYK